MNSSYFTYFNCTLRTGAHRSIISPNALAFEPSKSDITPGTMLAWIRQACIKVCNMHINDIVSDVEQVYTMTSNCLYLCSASTTIFKCNQYKPYNNEDYYNRAMILCTAISQNMGPVS